MGTQRPRKVETREVLSYLIKLIVNYLSLRNITVEGNILHLTEEVLMNRSSIYSSIICILSLILIFSIARQPSYRVLYTYSFTITAALFDYMYINLIKFRPPS